MNERYLAYGWRWTTSADTSHSYHIVPIRRFTDRHWRIYDESCPYFIKVIVVTIIIDRFYFLYEKMEQN